MCAAGIGVRVVIDAAVGVARQAVCGQNVPQFRVGSTSNAACSPPPRTAGGTRRYSDDDLARLQRITDRSPAQKRNDHDQS